MAYRPEPVTRRPALVASLIVMVLAGIAVGAWAMVAKPKVLRAPVVELPGPLRDVLPELNGPPVVIESEPPGASIQSAAGTLGVTPWAGNNPFLNDTELTLTLKGHQPKKVKLPGAKEAHLTVTLKRVSR